MKRELPVSTRAAAEAAEAEATEAASAVASAATASAKPRKRATAAARTTRPPTTSTAAGKPKAASVKSATPAKSAAASDKPTAASAKSKAAAGKSAAAPAKSVAKSATVSGKPTSATPAELAALAAMPKEGLWSIGGRELKLTNLDKVLFPALDGSKDPPITKRELIAYFVQIGPAILPHLADRPLNLHRFPNGVGGPGFWQKDLPSTVPEWLGRWKETGVAERDANTHLIADEVATLAWLANQAAFEIHAWTGRLDAPDKPTFALVDIDPGERTTWEETLAIARLYRAAFEHLGARAYPKLTGKRGIQARLPIVPKYSFSETSAWVEKLSRAIGAMVPDLVSWEWSVNNRQGKARLDYTQNTYIKTLVAPYAVRPAAGAPLSAPIAWAELDDPTLRPNSFTIRNEVDRVAKLGDLFAGAQTDAQELPKL